jgi:hypothetical protein
MTSTSSFRTPTLGRAETHTTLQYPHLLCVLCSSSCAAAAVHRLYTATPLAEPRRSPCRRHTRRRRLARASPPFPVNHASFGFTHSTIASDANPPDSSLLSSCMSVLSRAPWAHLVANTSHTNRSPSQLSLTEQKGILPNFITCITNHRLSVPCTHAILYADIYVHRCLSVLPICTSLATTPAYLWPVRLYPNHAG